MSDREARAELALKSGGSEFHSQLHRLLAFSATLGQGLHFSEPVSSSVGVVFPSGVLNRGACTSQLPPRFSYHPQVLRGCTAWWPKPRPWGQSSSVLPQLSLASDVASEEGQAVSSEAATSEWAWVLGLWALVSCTGRACQRLICHKLDKEPSIRTHLWVLGYPALELPLNFMCLCFKISWVSSFVV